MDLALAPKVDQRADRILDWHAVIDGMKLVKLDPVEPQPFQALRADTSQVLRLSVDGPGSRTRAGEPAFAR
jgi:hypothetical protein